MGAWIDNEASCGGRTVILGVPVGQATMGRERLIAQGVTPGCGGVFVREGDSPTAEELFKISDQLIQEYPTAISAGPDWRRHVVVLRMPEVTPDLRRSLKTVYQDKAILDYFPGHRPELQSRDRDTSLFYSGARWRTFRNGSRTDELGDWHNRLGMAQ